MDDRIIIESLDKRNVNTNMNGNEIVHQQPIVKNENKSTLEVVMILKITAYTADIHKK